MTYVQAKDGTPLMPCSDAISRILRKEGKARVEMTTPFTIRLNYETSTYKQFLQHNIDAGSGTIGSAVTGGDNEKETVVFYTAEIEVRNDITEKMTRRAKHRRSRRNKKTRYRPAKFDNRGNSTKENRINPTVTSKIHSHEKEIDFVNSILPIQKLKIEGASFDMHAMKNPEVLKDTILYQQGTLYQHVNLKAYVRDRDNHTCQHCKGKRKEKRNEVHHILFKKDWGSDDPKNLITLCLLCHDDVHAGIIVLKQRGVKKTTLKHATQMNVISSQLSKRFPYAEKTFGYITKVNRELIGLKKSHAMDAVAIGYEGKPMKFKTNEILYKKSVAKGDYQLRKGVRSQMVIPVGKVHGFRKFDKVLYEGKECLIKGRMSTGYAVLMDVHGTQLKFDSMPKLEDMKRISARKSVMIFSEKLAS